VRDSLGQRVSMEEAEDEEAGMPDMYSHCYGDLLAINKELILDGSKTSAILRIGFGEEREGI